MGNPLRVTATAVVCSTIVTLSACATHAAPPAPASSPSASAPAPAKKLTGAVVYLDKKDTGLVLHTVRGGTDSTVTIATGGGMCPYNSVVVSPDGQRVAWVSTVDPNGSGKVTVASLPGAAAHVLPVNASCLGNDALIWVAPDQLSVATTDGSGRGLVDPTTGAPVGNEDRITGAWSADGAWLATVDGSGKPVVMPKGSPGAARPYTYTPPADEAAHYDGWEARSVSVDGRYVAVGWVGTDPSRQLDTFAVVDTTTGAPVTLPVPGRVRSVHFLADGTVLAQTDTRIVLLDKDFTILDQSPEPASVHGLPVLRYLS